jgi:hypothetical protein
MARAAKGSEGGKSHAITRFEPSLNSLVLLCLIVLYGRRHIVTSYCKYEPGCGAFLRFVDASSEISGCDKLCEYG